MTMTEVLTGCRRLVLSPHLDDGALSCGGALARWAAAGARPAVVTVFAGWPTGPLTTFARRQHARWGGASDLVGQRRAEDARAMAVLGARSVWLDFPDCIYRGERYTTEQALFGSVAPDEAGLAATVAAALMELSQTTDQALVYAPLGLGNHVDHQLVRTAAEHLQRRGVPVAWYEDFPYAVRPGGQAQLRALTAALRPETVAIADVLEQKIAAIACYATQLPVLFGTAVAMPAAVSDYAAVVGDGQPAERYWRAPAEA